MVDPNAQIRTSFYRTPLFARISALVALLDVYSALVVALDHSLFKNTIQVKSTLHSYLTLALDGQRHSEGSFHSPHAKCPHVNQPQHDDNTSDDPPRFRR